MVLVNVRLAVVGVLNALPGEPPVASGVELAPTGLRRVYLDGWHEIPVYAMDALGSNNRISGPALVESKTTTVLLHAGDVASVTGQGWLDIEVANESSKSTDSQDMAASAA